MRSSLKISVLLVFSALLASATGDHGIKPRLKRQNNGLQNKFRGQKWPLPNSRFQLHKQRRRRLTNLFGCDCGLADKG